MNTRFGTYVTGVAIALSLFAGAGTAHASLLSSPQIQAIVGLLESFNVDSAMVASVRAALYYQTDASSVTTSTPATAAASCVNLTYNLSLGSTDATTNGDVTRLQNFLGVNPTGYFGKSTQSMLRQWQSAHGIVSSGSPSTTGYGAVGARTRQAMSCTATTTANTMISAQGAMTTAVGPQLVDATNESWKLVDSSAQGYGNQIAVNGVTDPNTHNVTLLMYYNNLIYQQNSDGNWWYKAQASDPWTATSDPRTAVVTAAPVTPTVTESAQGATVTSVGPQLVGATGEVWKLVDSSAQGYGNQIVVNGTTDANTYNVTLLLYYNHLVYQQNSAGNWWSKAKGSDTWTATSDPRVTTTTTTTTTTITQTTPTGGTPAKSAYAFIDTLGVEVHMADGLVGDAPYSNVSKVEQNITYLGFKYARDFAGVSNMPVLKQINSAIGTKFDLYLPTGWGTTASQAISLLQQYASMVASAEGYNEVDNWAPSGSVTGDQQSLYSGMKGNSATANIPVYCFTLGNAGSNSYNYGNNASSCDYATSHSYPVSGNIPYSWLQSWSSQSLNWASGRPIVITEGGYSTRPDTEASVDINTHAKLELNYVFDTFIQNVGRTYLYELGDQGSYVGSASGREANFGLFYGDNTPKPAATALHNLTTLLSDSSFTPGSLSYSVSGLPSSAHQVLLEKSNGTFVLVLWNEAAPNWSSGTASTGAVNVNLSLGSTKTVTVYDPINGTSPTSSLGSQTSATISVPDHPVLVFIN